MAEMFDDGTLEDSRKAVSFSNRLMQIAVNETDGPAIAATGLLYALCRVVVTMARSRSIDLDEVRAGLLEQVGRIFDLHRG